MEAVERLIMLTCGTHFEEEVLNIYSIPVGINWFPPPSWFFNSNMLKIAQRTQMKPTQRAK